MTFLVPFFTDFTAAVVVYLFSFGLMNTEKQELEAEISLHYITEIPFWIFYCYITFIQNNMMQENLKV